MEKDLKHFSLQFFAEQEDEVDEEETNNSDEGDSEEETFQDGDESEDDVETSDEETDEIDDNRADEKQKTKQSKKENEYFKKLRLSSKQTEQQKSSVDANYEKGRVNGILEAVNHTNPFTNEKIEDDEDIQEFLIMREMKEKGLDPVEDYSKYLKSLAREKRVEQSKNEKETNFVQNDIQIFSERYPNLKINDVLNNEEFVAFANASIGKVPLADLYENYEKFTSNISNKKAKEVEDEVNKSKARSKASSGNLGTNSQPKKRDFGRMSDAEFNKYLERAKRGELSRNYK
jgi:hypothetical protein